MRKIVHSEGHDIIDTIYKKLVVHPEFVPVSKPEISYDKVNGHMYGFVYHRKKLSIIPRHEGEREEYDISFYAEDCEILVCFMNNGYTFNVENAEMFNS